MKIVILSAFGRLQSEPMEWPDEPLEIRLRMAPTPDGNYLIGKDVIESAPMYKAGPVDVAFIIPTSKVGVFTHTGAYRILANGQSAAIYELTNISPL